jgi:hypothetical protein
MFIILYNLPHPNPSPKWEEPVLLNSGILFQTKVELFRKDKPLPLWGGVGVGHLLRLLTKFKTT